MAKAKGKGPAYERKMCGQLSLWVSNYTRDDLFWRSAMSGGRARVKHNKGDAQMRHFDAHLGDITATHRLGHLFIDLFIPECKHYKDLMLDCPMFGRGTGKMIPFWKDLLDLREKYKREPFMIMRQNHQPDLVGTTTRGMEILRCGGRVSATVYFPRYDLYLIPWHRIIHCLNFKGIRRVHGLKAAKMELE